MAYRGGGGGGGGGAALMSQVIFRHSQEGKEEMGAGGKRGREGGTKIIRPRPGAAGQSLWSFLSH